MTPVANPQKIISGVMPKYHQLLVILRNQILTREFAPHARLPSEEALCNTYGLSRGTVRKAIAQLEAERLIETEHGVGSFVMAVHPNAIPFRFTDSILAPAEEVKRIKFRVVSQELIAAPLDIAERLHVLPGSSILHIARQRLLDDQVVAYSERFMPEQMLPSLLETNLAEVSSLPDRINDETDFPLLRFDISMEAHLATEDEARLLQVKVGDPIIIFTRMTYSAPNHPAVWYRGLFKGEYHLNVRIDESVVTDYRPNWRAE